MGCDGDEVGWDRYVDGIYNTACQTVFHLYNPYKIHITIGFFPGAFFIFMKIWAPARNWKITIWDLGQLTINFVK